MHILSFNIDSPMQMRWAWRCVYVHTLLVFYLFVSFASKASSHVLCSMSNLIAQLVKLM
jgi:hypothetical protein